MVLAYHDAGSDGGVFTATVEMMFAGRCGASLLLEDFCRNETADIIPTLFTEELAAGTYWKRPLSEDIAVVGSVEGATAPRTRSYLLLVVLKCVSCVLAMEAADD